MVFAPSAVLLLAGVALSLAGSEPLGLAALWTLAALEEVSSLRPLFLRHPAELVRSPEGDTLQPEPVELPAAELQRGPFRGASVGHSPPEAKVADEPLHPSLDDEPLEPTIVQQFVRRQGVDGGETIEGLLRAHVARGQRHATAHVAICPPLGRVGECFAEACDGPPSSVKVAQLLAHGVRFEIKLDEPAAEADSVVVEFAIHSAAEPA